MFRRLGSAGLEDLTKYGRRTAKAQHGRLQLSTFFSGVVDGTQSVSGIKSALDFAASLAVDEQYRNAQVSALSHHDHVASLLGLEGGLSTESVALYLNDLDMKMRRRQRDKDYVVSYFKTKLKYLFIAASSAGRIMPNASDTRRLKKFALFLGEAIGGDVDVKRATPVRPIMIHALSSLLHRSLSPSLRDRVMLAMSKVLFHTGARSGEFTDNCPCLDDVTLHTDGSVSIRLVRTKSNPRPTVLLLCPLGDGAAAVCGARALHEWVHYLRHHHHMPTSSFLFPFVDGDTFTSSHWPQTEFSSSLKLFLRRAGCAFLYSDVSDPTGHSFRRALTTIAEEEGVSPDFVTRYLRWAMDLCRIRYTHSTHIVATAIASALTSALSKELSQYSMSQFVINRAELPSSRPLVRRQASSPVLHSVFTSPIVATSSSPSPSSPSPSVSPQSRAPLAPSLSPSPVQVLPLRQRHHHHALLVDEEAYRAAGYGIGREQHLLAQPLPEKRTRKPVTFFGR